MKTPVRRRTAAAALLLLAPVIAACGFGVQTDQVYQPAVGVDDRSSQVDVLNAVVVSDQDGSGRVLLSLVNNDQEKADQLVSITGSQVLVKDQQVSVPADGLVNLVNTPPITLTGALVSAGKFTRLTLTFQNAEPVTMNVPVVARTGDYANIEVSPSASPTKTPRRGEGSTETPTPESTPGSTITPSTDN